MDRRGFTLIELLMVIVIIGTLAAVVGPRFFDRQVFDERLFFEESLGAVRYGQKLAVASGCQIRARVDADGYALSYAAACGGVAAGAAVGHPSGGDYAADNSQAVTVTSALDVTFNSLGCVSSTNTCPSVATTFSAEIGGSTFVVHPATGFIETTP
jgi:MSHA pilin protein MshC